MPGAGAENMKQGFVMKLRIKFGKKGAVRFIGHLDMMRYFQKALRRAGFDLTYTKGFHPHPVMSFASPLGLGLESCGEYMDIEVESLDVSVQEMKERLQSQMAEGIDVYHISILEETAKNAMASLAAADYLVSFQTDPALLQQNISSFLSRKEHITEKKTKRGTAQIDIRPLVYELSAEENENIRLFMKLSASSAANVKPELVVSEVMGDERYLEDSSLLRICRMEMYARQEDELSDPFVPFSIYQSVSS